MYSDMACRYEYYLIDSRCEKPCSVTANRCGLFGSFKPHHHHTALRHSLLSSNHLLTLINSSAIVFDMILKKYAKPQRRIIPIYSSSLRLDLSLTVSKKLQLSSIIHHGIPQCQRTFLQSWSFSQNSWHN